MTATTNVAAPGRDRISNSSARRFEPPEPIQKDCPPDTDRTNRGAVAGDLFPRTAPPAPTTLAGAIDALEWRAAVFGHTPCSARRYVLPPVIGGLCALAPAYEEAPGDEQLGTDHDAILAARPATVAGAAALLVWRLVMFGDAPISREQLALQNVIAGLRDIALRYGELPQ